MAGTIAIIGLGQIGTSIGLVLRERSAGARLIGSDKNAAAARQAEILGVFDKIAGPKDAARDADVVVLSLPLSELRKTLSDLGPVLQEGSVVLETTPVKRQIADWVQESIPAGRYYIGLVPSVNPESLGDTGSGPKAARADLFKRTVMIIDARPGTPPEVEQLAINFARLLGAKPLLTDPMESDGLMTTAHILPQLVSAALLDSSVDRPGWLEARKLAGRPFASVTGGLAYYDDPASLGLAALSNPAVTIHALDTMMAALKGIRDAVQAEDGEALTTRLKEAFAARERWLDERGSADWLKEGGGSVDLPQPGEQVLQMLFGGRIVDRMKGQFPNSGKTGGPTEKIRNRGK